MCNWTFNGRIVLEDDYKSSIGFLYKITHPSSGRWYLGRKMLTKSKITQSKGIKKKSKVESDWKEYWSSSKEIQELVALEGTDKFTREILIFCDTKATMTLGEEYILHVSGSMFDEKCFNQNIRAKIYKSWFKKTPNFFNSLQELSL